MTLTNLLVVVNVLAFVWELQTGALSDGRILYREGGLLGIAVSEGGQWWRVFSAGFLHGGIAHIGMNMWALWAVGNQAEQLYGKLRYALLYAASLAGAGYAVVYATPEQLTIGASGAIFGLFGALVAAGLRLGSRGREWIRSVIPVIVINLVFTFAFPGISWAAHLGGLLTGFLAGYVLFLTIPRRREPVYAYVYPAQAERGVETIEQPPDAGPHEEHGAPPFEVRDPRE